MAIAGFVLSLLGCTSPLGIIFSAIGLNQINKDPSQGGKGLALAGLIIGIICVVFYIIWAFFWTALFGTAIEDIYDYNY